MSDKRKILTITTAGEGLRLDVSLFKAHSVFSRSLLKKLILAGNVTTNGKTITDPAYLVKSEQIFTIFVPCAEPVKIEAENIELDIQYEDDDVIVINKPAGLVMHPGAGTPNGTLVNALLNHCGTSLSGIGGIKRPGIVHRLDKDTSGLIVAAKNDLSHQSLSIQFERREVERAYHALAWGTPKPLFGQIEGNIGRHPHKRKKMAVVTNNRGKFARTKYQTLQCFGKRACKLECRLSTGRTHQIRVHLAYLGHPLIGDPVYSRTTESRLAGLSDQDKEILKSFKRQALHAGTLGFQHPRNGSEMHFESGLPEDFKNLNLLLEKSEGSILHT